MDVTTKLAMSKEWLLRLSRPKWLSWSTIDVGRARVVGNGIRGVRDEDGLDDERRLRDARSRTCLSMPCSGFCVDVVLSKDSDDHGPR